MQSEKSTDAYTAEQYRIMEEESANFLIERFDIPPDFAKKRAKLEIESLKETFRRMPEFSK